MYRKLLFIMLLSFTALTASAQTRRPVDNEHPLWFVHIDAWNAADPQKIIDLIQEDIRPYVCFNLSLSCSYDVDRAVYVRPQNAVLTLNSWATVCQQNNVWFTCQQASGGHAHLLDSEVEVYESFFKNYPNFLGWNFAEQFWGFDEAGDRSSAKADERIALFAKLVTMSHEYGGFLVISYCGNTYSHNLNPVAMMKRNAKFYNACRQYPDAIMWLYKYTTAACWYNNESVTLSPFISGLSNYYGVRHDICGWNSALEHLAGSKHKHTYPTAAGIGTVVEQTCVNGGCVWDGPELITTECFQETATSSVSGYTQRNWSTFPQIRNAWMDIFRKIIDGTLYIPSRKEVVERTKVIVINDVESGSDEERYASWNNLYDGLYKQTDPFNQNNGYFMDNYLHYKKTGRYAAIPVTIVLNDELAKSIPVQVQKSRYSRRWGTQAKKVAEFDSLYPEVSTGDLYVSRFKNQLVTYYPYSYFNGKKTAEASIPLQYNTCESIDLQLGVLGTAVLHEYADRIDAYLNNFRTDTTTLVTETITLKGAKTEPTYELSQHPQAQASATATWDAASGTYTLAIKHMGAVDVSIACQGGATDRSTDMVPCAPLATPEQPKASYLPVTVEAEDMNYKNIKQCVTFPYSSHPDVRGHSGNGFADMGIDKTGGLRHSIKTQCGGEYDITLRYTNTDKEGKLSMTIGGSRKYVTLSATGKNEWAEVTLRATLKEGANTVVISNAAGIGFFLDNVTYTPLEVPDAIEPVNGNSGSGSGIAYYDLNGVRHTSLVRGLNIVRDANGNTRKIYIK